MLPILVLFKVCFAFISEVEIKTLKFTTHVYRNGPDEMRDMGTGKASKFSFTTWRLLAKISSNVLDRWQCVTLRPRQP